MSIICIAKGTATMGLTTRGADGKIISQTPARWEHDPDGGCVALWTMNPETEEQEAPARIYGDWQASEYLGDVLAELKPRRKVNLPARQGGRSAICASRWISPCRKRLPTRRENGCGRSATRRILHTTSRQTGSYTEVMRHTTQNKAGCPGSSSWRT